MLVNNLTTLLGELRFIMILMPLVMLERKLVSVGLMSSLRTTMSITSSDILLTKCFGFLINSIWQKLKNSLKETLSQ